MTIYNPAALPELVACLEEIADRRAELNCDERDRIDAALALAHDTTGMSLEQRIDALLEQGGLDLIEREVTDRAALAQVRERIAELEAQLAEAQQTAARYRQEWGNAAAEAQAQMDRANAAEMRIMGLETDLEDCGRDLTQMTELRDYARANGEKATRMLADCNLRIAELEANRNYISSCLEYERQDKDRYVQAYALLQARIRDLHTLGRELLSKYESEARAFTLAVSTEMDMAELEAEIAAYRARLDG